MKCAERKFISSSSLVHNFLCLQSAIPNGIFNVVYFFFMVFPLFVGWAGWMAGWWEEGRRWRRASKLSSDLFSCSLSDGWSRERGTLCKHFVSLSVSNESNRVSVFKRVSVTKNTSHSSSSILSTTSYETCQVRLTTRRRSTFSNFRKES